MSHNRRILVKLCRGIDNTGPMLAHFTECVLNYFGLTNDCGTLYVELRDNYLVVSDSRFAGSSEAHIRHAAFCPVLNLTPELVSSLPEEVCSRGIDVGVSVILQTSDGKILLSRRASHLRIFPGLWVPPGGHVEENETLVNAGLRELKEETGLDLKLSECHEQKIDLLALWESVYPSKLSVGLPFRHHIVVYFRAKLVEDLTAEVMQDRISFDPEEVDACAWLDRDVISAIAQSFSEGYDENVRNEHLPKVFRATTLDENKKQVITDLPTQPLVRGYSEDVDVKDRVSTGTKFVLQKLLQLETQ